MLSIIYVNYKTSDDILTSLASIVKYEKKINEYEFIIVDNNSGDDGLVDIKKTYPFVEIINAPKNGGFAYGNNIGIKHSKEDIILLLNPDTYIHDNSIELMMNRLKDDPEIDIIGPSFFYADGSSQADIIPKSYLTLWKLFCEQFWLQRIFKKSKLFNSYLKTYIAPEKECFVKTVSGAAFMFKRSIIEKIGLMDETFFLYFEETDYCRRAHKNKLKMLYFPKSKITHTIGSSTKSVSETRVQNYLTSFKYYFKKNYKQIGLYVSMATLFSGCLIRFIIFRMKNDKKSDTQLLYLKNILTNYPS